MAKKSKESNSGDVLADLEKKYGINRVAKHELTVVSTGSLQLDRAMGVGGTALGKMIELFGENSSGKSTIALHQMAEYQKAFPDKRVALLDWENSFDVGYAEAIGVDTDKLLVYQCDSQEQGFDLALGLISKELVSCIVIDSQTAAAPKAIIDGEMGDSTIGLQARNNSKFCLKVKGLLNLHGVTLFIISQTRSNIGGYGDGTVTSGGNAIKFYADARWKIWKINDKDHELNKTTVDVVKNKLGKPFGVAKFAINWGLGIDRMGEVIEYAIDFDFIKRGAAGWLTIGEDKVQGVEKLKEYFVNSPEIYEDLEKRVLDKLNNVEIVEEEIVEEEEQNESNGIY